jgi:hypothetical protein
MTEKEPSLISLRPVVSETGQTPLNEALSCE